MFRKKRIRGSCSEGIRGTCVTADDGIARQGITCFVCSAVMYRTDRTEISERQGLYREQPVFEDIAERKAGLVFGDIGWML